MTVVDASVALKWFVEEEGSARARGLMDRATYLAAPDLIVAEVCNGAWRLERLGVLDETQCRTIAAELVSLFDRISVLGPLAPRATAIARALDHPVHDCFYVALAERDADRVVTADRRLVERLQGTEWQALALDLYTLESTG